MQYENHTTLISDLSAGHAAEHLVCADLLLQGHNAFLSTQVCAYDIAVDIAGRLIRVQVKATRGPRAIPRAIPQRTGHFPAYMWHVRRAGKKGLRNYGASDFDMLALVALDTRQIAYMPMTMLRQTVHIRPDDGRPPSNKTGKYFSDFQFALALSHVLGGVV